MSGVPDDSLAEESLAAEESSENRALNIRSVRSVSEDEAKTPLVSSSDAFPSSFSSLATFAPVDDLEGVLAAAGVPAGAPRRAMARAHRALVAGDCVSSSELGPETSSETAEARGIRVARARRSVAARFAALTHREASRWAALTSELLARGVGAENALRVAWTHVYARGEVSEDARRATRVAFARHVKPFLDATRRDFTEESIPRAGFLQTENVVDASLVARWARSTLVEPLGWPEPAATATPPADVESRARRAGALLETVAGTLYGRERAAADALSATNGRYTSRVSALALAAFPLRAPRRRLALDRSATQKGRAVDENASDAFPSEAKSIDDDENEKTTEKTHLLHLLRASGHAFICGVAHGASGGLPRASLVDAAAWLRRLARRFEEEEDTSRLPLATVSRSPVPDHDSLGACAELRALAHAADALAAHAVTSLAGVSFEKAFLAEANAAALEAIRDVAARGAARAARAAAVSSAEVSLSKVSADVASALQLSVSFRAQPESRDRGARAHALVAALAPALDAAAAFETAVALALVEILLRAGAEILHEKNLPLANAIEALKNAQDRRFRLEALACATPAAKMRRGDDGSPPCASAAHAFAVAHHLLRAALAELGDAAAACGSGNVAVDVETVLRTASGDDFVFVDHASNTEKGKSRRSSETKKTEPTTPASAWETWRHACSRVDAALGVPTGDPPLALLWRHGGRPAMPRSASLRVAEDRTRALCAAPAGQETRAAVPAAASSLESYYRNRFGTEEARVCRRVRRRKNFCRREEPRGVSRGAHLRRRRGTRRGRHFRGRVSAFGRAGGSVFLRVDARCTARGVRGKRAYGQTV